MVHIGLHIELRSPAPDATLKRRSGETVTFEVAVTPGQHLRPGDVIVELWSAVHDPLGEQLAAIPLHYVRDEGEVFIFSLSVPLQHTGNFPLRIRGRVDSQPFWEWAEHGHDIATINLWVDPAWVYDAVVYNAFVRYFGAKEVGKSGELKKIRSGTFKDIQKHMDKLRDMGINVLYLNPVHMIGELYRNYNPHDLLPDYLQPGCPYSVKDYKSIDPELSFDSADLAEADHPLKEFKKFVDAAHARGIRVFMDLVFNHSAHDAVFQRIHPEWFLYKQDICSLEEPYIYPHEIRDGKPWGDPKHTFAPFDQGWWWRDAAQLNWNNIEKYPDFIMPQKSANAPPKNPTIKEMYTYFRNIVLYWIREFGIDGFRCDVAYRVPLEFWKDCITEARKAAKEAHPDNGSIDGDVVFIAEDYHVAMPQLLEAGFTACYGDFGNKLTTLPQITGYLDYMYNIGGQHFPQGTIWFIFPECHDFHRNAERLAKDLRERHKDAGLNANKSRWTLTACLPGIPMIFNGFEKVEWERANLFSYSTIDWESDKDISRHIKRVNIIRRNSPALQRGRYHYLHTSEGIKDESKLFSFARIYGDDAIIVAVNLSLTSAAEGIIVYLADELPIDYSKPYTLVDLYNRKSYKREGKELKVYLPAGEAHIFKVQQAS